LFCFNKEFLSILNAIIDYRNFIVYINKLEKPITIPKNARLSTIYNYNKEGYYSYILVLKTKKVKTYGMLKYLESIDNPIILENGMPFYKFTLSIGITILKNV
jgi:hypothetical protein